MTKRDIERRQAKIDKGIVALAVHALNLKSEMEQFAHDLRVAQIQSTSSKPKKIDKRERQEAGR